MKKYICSLMLVLMALVSVGLVSCSDDDEPKASDIVGTWAYDTQVIGDYAIFFQFTKDGKFHEVHTSIIHGETVLGDVFHGTYTVSGRKLTVTYNFQYETETINCTYSVKGDKLTLNIEGEGAATFNRVKDSIIEPYL